MNLDEYLSSITKRYLSGISKEHSYRGDLEQLIRSIVPGVEITNEPTNVTECGNPDYVITREKIPTGYIEAKDIGKDLDAKHYSEQFDRYRKALDNLIITDYLCFRFFQHGNLITEIHIGEIRGKTIAPLAENFDAFIARTRDFCSFVGRTITSAQKLAELMAAKARLLQNILENALVSDQQSDENSALRQQLETFKRMLIHDITPKEFADVYAQTLAYGMFAARLHDSSLDTFSRIEAANLIPKSNPFLRKLFQHIAGFDIDQRIATTVDNLADVFRATDIKSLLSNFGKSTEQSDPVIHFYETFLAEYDAKLRKTRGVWYTPEPVVQFIVRAVDDLLKSEFGLEKGIADTERALIELDSQVADGRSKTGYKRIQKEVHRVQILDPATGTGTFLSEVVKFIYKRHFISMPGAWSGYVENDLVPRLNGFELLMASYAMAHLKLDLLLTEMGYRQNRSQRFRIFLTNSLEEHHPDTGTLFASWLSTEASEANHIKRDTPVMVVMGNPPYSVSNSNKGEWIQNLVSDYKKDVKERNLNALSDDYIKFIRFGEHVIEKNGEGILAYISNNSFIDGVTHRAMRHHLLKVFDSIYILNLHGDSNRRETSPDGSIDQNVFDIQQGVSINLFVKTGKKAKSKLGKVFYCDLYGSRKTKYDYLRNTNISEIAFNELTLPAPYYFFVPKNFDIEKEYKEGFSVDELFIESGTGIKFRKDNLLIRKHLTRASVHAMLRDISLLDRVELLKKYDFKETDDWKIEDQRTNFADYSMEDIIPVQYRPFDVRYTYYPLSKISKIIPRGDSRKDLMRHMLAGENVALLTGRQNKSAAMDSFFVTSYVSEMKCAERTIQSYHFPLYIYPRQPSLGAVSYGVPNFNLEIARKIAEGIGLQYDQDGHGGANDIKPIDIFDYVYAVVHSPRYREKYKEFIKVDFPRVPYPNDATLFCKLVVFGRRLRELHLLKIDVVDYAGVAVYPVDGDNVVSNKVSADDFKIDESTNSGRLWINSNQYFDNVPMNAWDFFIGGYQPAQKWLKDRYQTKLSFDDIRHYQKMISAIVETLEIMKEINTTWELA